MSVSINSNLSIILFISRQFRLAIGRRRIKESKYYRDLNKYSCGQSIIKCEWELIEMEC